MQHKKVVLWGNVLVDALTDLETVNEWLTSFYRSQEIGDFDNNKEHREKLTDLLPFFITRFRQSITGFFLSAYLYIIFSSLTSPDIFLSIPLPSECDPLKVLSIS